MNRRAVNRRTAHHRTAHRRALNRRSVVAGGALALALLFCAVAARDHVRARGDASLAHARARDAALADGRTRLAVLVGTDARDPGGTRSRWLDAATGPLHEELRRAPRPKPGPGTRATVTAAALTALDTRAGTATLIATVRVDPADAGGARAGAAAGERKRLEATLARTPDGWKVESLDAVPVGDA